MGMIGVIIWLIGAISYLLSPHNPQSSLRNLLKPRMLLPEDLWEQVDVVVQATLQQGLLKIFSGPYCWKDSSR